MSAALAATLSNLSPCLGNSTCNSDALNRSRPNPNDTSMELSSESNQCRSGRRSASATADNDVPSCALRNASMRSDTSARSWISKLPALPRGMREVSARRTYRWHDLQLLQFRAQGGGELETKRGRRGCIKTDTVLHETENQK
eukprot:94927-Amphidinium_carterae.4